MKSIYNFDLSDRISVPPSPSQSLHVTTTGTTTNITTTTPTDVITVDEKAEVYYKAIESDVYTINLKQIAWELYNSNVNKAASTAAVTPTLTSVKKVFQDSGLKDVFVNSFVRLYEKHLPTVKRSSAEPCVYIRSIRTAWEDGINEELLAIASEMNRPLVRNRVAVDSSSGSGVTGDVKNPWFEPISSYHSVIEAVRFLLDSEDVYETMVSIKNPNVHPAQLARSLGVIHLDFQHPYNAIPSLSDLVIKFSELGCTYSQLGLDEMSIQYGNKLSIARHEEGEGVLSCGNVLHARQYMKRGVNPSLRGRIWRLAFGMCDDPTSEELKAYTKLLTNCHKVDLITDELYIHDVSMTVDDPRFFVFEEELKEMALCFSRDEWVLRNSLYEIHRPLQGHYENVDIDDGSTLNASADKACPPCGVQPFLGFSSYLAPLCYVYKDPVAMYSFFRNSFASVWCKLNVFTTDYGTLLHISKTFESLLMLNHPRLFMHLVNIGVTPVKVALPWMQLGFVNLLEIDQVLHLWDRLYGYMDAVILAVLAAAIFVSRTGSLLMCTNSSDAIKLLSEGSRLRVVPLLQMMLYSEK